MLDSLFESFAALLRTNESWFGRVRENLREALVPARTIPSSANGAPIHLLMHNASLRRAGRAQGFSVLAHAGIIAVLALIAAQAHLPRSRNAAPNAPLGRVLFPVSILSEIEFGPGALGNGGGGQHNPIPATRGDLPWRSSFQLLQPHLPDGRNHELQVNPTLLDPNAPPIVDPPFVQIGLPWMKDKSDSAGPGGPDGLGSTKGNTMGDGLGDGVGQGGPSGFYAKGVTMPQCRYCPDPSYTDEARQAKLQGGVALQVLVTADGRAADVRITRGIGLGLDERAAQTVRGWRFVPAHDSAGHAFPAWVTIEVSFHLF